MTEPTSSLRQPGISSALGCAASANIPLTHRDHAQTLTFVTGHAQKGGVPDLDWQGLAKPHQTIVVFMGVGTAPVISEKLQEAGLPGKTPVAVIENGTRPDMRVLRGLLAGQRAQNLEIVLTQRVCHHLGAWFDAHGVDRLQVLVIKGSPGLRVFQQLIAVPFQRTNQPFALKRPAALNRISPLVDNAVSRYYLHFFLLNLEQQNIHLNILSFEKKVYW